MQPVDIEWAYENGEFYILQARPITKINYNHYKKQWTQANWIDWNVVPSVCSQFLGEFYKGTFTNAMINYLKDIGLNENMNKEEDHWGEVYYGRLYWNVSSTKYYLQKLPGYVERKFDEDIDIKVTYKGDGHVTKLNLFTIFTGVKALFNIQKSFKNLIKSNESLLAEQRENFTQIDQIDHRTMSDEDLFNFYEKLIKEDLCKIETSYSRQFFEISNAVTLFKPAIKKYKSVKYINLLRGLKNVSHLLPNFELWNISRNIKNNKDFLEYWKKTEEDKIKEHYNKGTNDYCMDEIRGFVDKYG